MLALVSVVLRLLSLRYCSSFIVETERVRIHQAVVMAKESKTIRSSKKEGHGSRPGAASESSSLAAAAAAAVAAASESSSSKKDATSTDDDMGPPKTTTTTTTTTTFTTVRWLPTVQALSRKNVLLLAASPWSFCILTIVLPLLVTGLTFGMQRLTERGANSNGGGGGYYYDGDTNHRNGEIETLVSPATQAIHKCGWYDVYNIDATDDCATILFAPSSSSSSSNSSSSSSLEDGTTTTDRDLINRIMSYMAKEAGLPFVPIPETTSSNNGNANAEPATENDPVWLSHETWSGGTVLGVPSVQDIGRFMVAHPGRAQAILYFSNKLQSSTGSNNSTAATSNTTTSSGGGTNTKSPIIHFRFNSTYSSHASMQNEMLIPMALQRAAMAVYGNKDEINIRISRRNMFADFGINDRKNNDNKNDPTSLSQEEQEELEREERQREHDKEQTKVELVSYLFGPIFIFASVMGSAMLSNHAAAEKSNGLIGSLRVVGMADSAYWFSWWMVGTVMVIVPACLVTMALTYMFDLALLTDVSFVALCIVFMVQYSLLFALSLFTVAVATNRPFLYALHFCVLCLCVTSVALGKTFLASPADNVGLVFQYLVPGYNLGGVLDSMYRYNTRADELWSSSSLAGDPVGNFSDYGFDDFFKSFGQCNETMLSLNNTCEEIKLFDSNSRGCWQYIQCRGMDPDYIWDYNECAPDSCYFYPLSGIVRIVIMVVQTIILMVLAWYALQVIPSGNGLTYPPWFIFTPKYWTSSFDRNNGAERSADQRRSRQEGSIILRGLTKRFQNNTAVNSIDMDIQNGQVRDFDRIKVPFFLSDSSCLPVSAPFYNTQVFVLLGHNGAGKSTVVNMLTGKLSPSSGEAYVMGLSVKNNVHGIQRLVSSVPQHDLLWGALSATEHIRMFAQIKGVPRRELNEEIKRVLHKVHLTDAAKQAAGGYSGGMKRRLSIALAGIGGPRIIMLDEPSTGIDPLNRRRIWNLIRELKRDRIVVLTTHLMQEADWYVDCFVLFVGTLFHCVLTLCRVPFICSLGDQIAVLDNGSIQAQGTPLNLKTEYGAGYSLSIVTDAGNVERVKALARQAMPNVDLVNEAAGSLAFGVHVDELGAIPALTRQLQGEGLIREWNISQSTLEEVFLRLASKSTLMQNRHQQMNVIAAHPQGDAPGDSVVGTETETCPAEVNEEGGFVDGEDVFATPTATWRLQLAALLRKAFILKKRHWIATLVQLVIPIALMSLAKKFFFSDISVGRDEVLVWPQAKIYNTRYYTSNPYDPNPNGENQCAFEWKLWSEKGEKAETGNEADVLTNSESAASSIELPDSMNSMSGLSFRVSGLSGEFEEDTVRLAVNDAMQYYLSRTNSEATQYLADAYCEQDNSCGPCYVDPFFLKVQDQDTGYIDFLWEGPSGYSNLMNQCQSSFRPCSLDEYRFVLSEAMVTEQVSQSLNASSLEIGGMQIFARSPVSSAQIFQSLSIQYYRGDDSTADSRQLCEICSQSMPHVWLSGQNAELFKSALASTSLDVTSEVTSTDIIQTIVRNRRFLVANWTSFSSTGASGTAVCANIGDEHIYGYSSAVDQGYVANDGTIEPWPIDMSESQQSFCNDTMQPLAEYRELFPDGGITLTAFNVADKSITLDVVWELDIGNIYYSAESDDEPFIPLQQSVYSMYCPQDDIDGDGQCSSISNLICVRVSPVSACEGGSYYGSESVLIDATYEALWGASGSHGGRPITQSVHGWVRVDYEPAVDLQELAVFVFMITVVIALHAPNTASVLVFEKNQRFVFAMLLNGLKIYIYWIAQYLAHLITSGSLAAVTIFLGIVLRLKPYSSQHPNYGLLIAVLFAGIHAQFGFVVFLSSFFKKERFAAVLVGFLVLSILGSAILVHTAGGNSLAKEWPPVLSLVPMFGFFRCLLLVFWKRYYTELWTHVGVMLGSSAAYLAMGIYWQSATGVGALCRLDCGILSHLVGSHSSAASSLHHEEDTDDVAEADIAKEEHRALRLNAKDTAIKVVHLGKTFPARPNPKHAVVDVTMAMENGEIFGLLGPNGKLHTVVRSETRP